MTVRELINELEAAAAEYGDFTPVIIDYGFDMMDIDNVAYDDGEIILE